MLFQKDAAIYIVPISAKLLLDDELGHIEHDLGAELMDLEKLDHRLRVSRIFPVDQCLEVQVQASLPFISVPLSHK